MLENPFLVGVDYKLRRHRGFYMCFRAISNNTVSTGMTKTFVSILEDVATSQFI